MEKYIAEFPEQIKDAVNLVEKVPVLLEKRPQNVVIAGMGGSGIAGTFMVEYADYRKAEIPVMTHKNYGLPYFVNENTLVIISSYSGNTEETIAALRVAIQRKAQIAAITSGGTIEKMCQENAIPVVRIPQNFPPRAALAYSLAGMFHILSRQDVFFYEWIGDMYEAHNILQIYQKEIRQQAKKVAEQIHHTFPIIYSLGGEAVPLRLRQQLNENSKVLCSHHIFPEMNHNEIVGWKCLNASHSVVVLRCNYDKISNFQRFEFCKNIFHQHNIPVLEIHAKGESFITQYLYLMHAADWISYELALLNQVDPMEVKVIEELKTSLKS
ncbi:MAG: bifunctional phosphoglucose/phosphomannose isomerase [Bacteroidetes bacterium]|nr:MAG: bifunctional phosphoglucose/phosphomannose isomerase [Bacteroidota bacterium]